MKKQKKFWLLFLILTIGCSNTDEESTSLDKYLGTYRVVSFKSNIAVDLNDDGMSSTELTNEINSFSFNDLEISHNQYQSNNAKLITFLFPKTWITFQYSSSPNGAIEFIDYGFLTRYQFKNDSFKLENYSYIEESYIDNVASNKEVTLNGDLKVVNDNHLSISISKEYYDFNINDWISLNIEVLYERQ